MKRLELDDAAFLAFVLTLPFSLRKVLFQFKAEEAGFNEYLDISLFLSDITLFFFVAVVLLKHANTKKSITSLLPLFHVEHMAPWLLLPLPFLAWSGVSLIWSESTWLAMYGIFGHVEGYLTCLALVLYIVPRGTNNEVMFHLEQSHESLLVEKATDGLKSSTWNKIQMIFVGLIASGAIQSLLAIYQFIIQKSAGLWFLGESFLSRSTDGVAKVLINHELIIRAYGTFSHPNVLAVFLLVSILCTVAYPLLFPKRMFHVEQLFRLDYLSALLMLQLVALLLSFSKSGIGIFILTFLMLITFLQVFVTSTHLENVPRGTFIRSLLDRLFHVEQVVILLAMIFFLGIAYFSLDIRSLWIQPVLERLALQEPFYTLLYNMPITGVGMNNYVLYLTEIRTEWPIWMWQPVHNVFLSVLSELGIIGLACYFVLWFGVPYTVYRNIRRINVPRGTFMYTYLVLTLWVGFVLFHMIDHLLYDIQQGRLLAWFLMGLVYTVFVVVGIDKKVYK